jgi:outer membrane receptor protein involved in Fe transport
MRPLNGHFVADGRVAYGRGQWYVSLAASNIFDNRYATYGTFFDTAAVPNFANGGAPFTDPRSVSPARPRALYAGLRATF